MPKIVVPFDELLSHACVLGHNMDEARSLLREVQCFDEDFDYYFYERDEIQDPESRLSPATQRILLSYMDEHQLDELEIV